MPYTRIIFVFTAKCKTHSFNLTCLNFQGLFFKFEFTIPVTLPSYTNKSDTLEK